MIPCDTIQHISFENQVVLAFVGVRSVISLIVSVTPQEMTSALAPAALVYKTFTIVEHDLLMKICFLDRSIQRRLAACGFYVKQRIQFRQWLLLVPKPR